MWRVFNKGADVKKWIGLSGILAGALIAAGCSDAVSPDHRSLRTPEFATGAPTGIVLDQQNGKLGDGGTQIWQNFEPTNPHVGDAIVATFVWLGSTNTIESVTDVLASAPFTPVGNTYTLVDYVTAGGVSMATYVATNVQNFPDGGTDTDGSLAVVANFSQPVSGGILISAWSGVNTVTAQALGPHSSALGSGSTATVADPGSITVGTGGLAYGVTFSNALVGHDSPTDFAVLADASNDAQSLSGETVYALPASPGSVDPQWTWLFSAPSSWLATVLTLNPPLHLAFTVQPSTTLPFTTMSPPVQVAALDAYGNPVPSFTGSMTIAIGHNGGMLMPGTLSGTKTVSAVNGVATFSDLSIDQLGHGYTLVVTASGLNAESTPFNIGPM